MSNLGFRPIYKFDAANLKALNDMLMVLWGKLTGRVEMRDLSAGARKVIDSKAESKTVDELAGTVTTFNTRITQTEKDIELKADAKTVDNLGRTVEGHSAQLIVMANEIGSKVSEQAFNELGQTVKAQATQINQTADAVKLKADAKTVDNLGQTVRDNHAEFELAANQISQRVTDEVKGLQTQINANAEAVIIAAGRTVGGTNLISSAEGNIWVQTGTVHHDWAPEDNYYYRSGAGVVMGPWSGSHNEIRFNTEIYVTPGEYTLSFYGWYTYLTTNILIRPNLMGKGADIYFDDQTFMPPPSTPTKHTLVLNVEHTGSVILRFVTMTPWTDGYVYFSDVKLERGNTATDWSPHPGDPSEGLDTGTGGGVQVTITKDRFNVNVPGEDGDFELNETGGSLPVLRSRHVEAPNLAYAYDGPDTIIVNPAATSGEIAAGGVYRSLPEALAALNNRQLAYDVTINVMGDSYGFEELYGVHGSPNGIVINGNGHTLTGRFRAANCATNIAVSGLRFVYDSAYGKDYAVNFDNCGHVDLKRCVISGNKLAARGAWFAWGTRAYLEACEFYDVTDSAIKAGDNVDLLVMNAKGKVPYFVWADGAVIKWGGTRPSGSYWEGLPSICNRDLSALAVDYGSAAPTVQPVRTIEFAMMHADSYAGGFENSWDYQQHNDIMQGYTEHAGRIFGCIWFDNAAIRSAGINTVNQATLRLTAQKYVGRGVAVEVHLWGTATEYAGRNGAPALTKDYGVIGSATPGEVTTITIPAHAAADLVGGAINGFVLYSDDTALYKDRNYSRNYMRFDGDTSGDASTRPVLTITHGGEYLLTVMTFNVQYFSGINASPEILDSIFTQYNPDIVGMQEYGAAAAVDGVDSQTFIRRYWDYTEVGGTNLVASKMALNDPETVYYADYTEPRCYQKMYVAVGGRRIAVFNTHLDYDYLGSPETPKVKQIKALFDAVAREEYFIILGDFNTVCSSTADPDYINMIKLFVDAGYHCANCSDQHGFYGTWTDGTTDANGSWEQTDNVVTSPNIIIKEVVIDRTKITANTGLTIDHLPIVARLDVR